MVDHEQHFTFMSSQTIEPEKMTKVLQSLGVDLSWDEVMSLYKVWRPTSALLFDHCYEFGIHKFAELFQFKNCYIEKCKKEIVEYLEEFPHLDGNTLEEIYDKMVQVIQNHNAVSDEKIIYVCLLCEFYFKK